MQNKVQIIPDEMGNVIRVSNNDEYGYVRLAQNTFHINNGFAQKKEVTTLLHGKLEDLREMGIQNKTELTGKIVVKEQLTPFSENNSDRDLKIAGSTGIICCVHGEPIYRKTMFTSDVTAEDVLLDHTNGDAIREANGNSPTANKLKKVAKAKAVEPSEAFDIEESTPVNEVKEETEEEISTEIEATEELEVENSNEELEIVEDENAFEL